MILKVENLPRHVAIIMDGNRRWAKARGLPAVAGHRKVVEERIEEVIERAGELGIEYITLWAFSTENWKREKSEVGGIMKLFRWALEKRAKRLIEKGARVKMIGDLKAFPEDIQKGFDEMMRASAGNEGIMVVFALNYGGRDEIVRAVRRMMAAQLRNTASRRQLMQLFREPVASMGDKLDEMIVSSLSSLITEECMTGCLDTGGMPDPDLIIRTSGEMRMSGFLPWQGAYAEYYFTKVLMPDFGAKELDEAVAEYGRRRRRYGG